MSETALSPEREPMRSALAAWHAADDRAREVERRVRDASRQRELDGTPVPEEMLRELLRSRAEANALLREAVALSHAARQDAWR